jgi:hypothetical protein
MELRNKFGFKMEEMTKDSRKNASWFVTLTDIIRVTMRWGRHVARMGKRNICRVLGENQKESDHLEDRSVGGRILSLNLNRMGLEWINLAQDRDEWRGLVMNLRVP